jgi:hypothetical protein
MNIWKSLFGSEPPDPTQPQIWTANPLVIADQAGEIRFAQRVEIEATPIDEESWSLRIAAGPDATHTLAQAKSYIAPETIGVQIMMSYDRLQKGNRGGSAFEGLSEDGQPVVWFTDAAADAFVLSKHTEAPTTVEG